MYKIINKFRVMLIAGNILLILSSLVYAQDVSNVQIKGQVKDLNGDIIQGAEVTIKHIEGKSFSTVTGTTGNFIFNNLLPGTYSLVINKEGFAEFTEQELILVDKQNKTFDVTLEIEVNESVEVGENTTVNLDPDSNASGVVFKGDDLNFLPDNPEDLASVLSILSGSTGPNGAEFLIDGFSNIGGRLPSRRQIAEVRINQNPFSAEYARIGFGRVSIRLRPTTNQFSGEGEYYFSDESLNSRNPYSANKPPFQIRNIYGALSGPIVKDKVSFYVAASRQAFDENAVINAITLNNQNEIVPVSRGLLTPATSIFSTFQVNYKVTKNNDLTFNYQYLPSDETFEGVGGLNLESRGYTMKDVNNIFRLIGTSILNPNTVYQYSFQIVNNTNRSIDAETTPAIQVLDSFVSGGADIGNSDTTTRQYQFSNHLTRTVASNPLRIGATIRGITIDDNSPLGFNGKYTFEGGNAPELDSNGNVILGQDGQPIISQISSIERYRRTQVFLQQGLTPAQIRERGGGATQFSITTGSPITKIDQYDLGVYAQYYWRVNSSLNLGMGLRYENQTNISSPSNLAPRLSFAWAPRGNKTTSPKSVIRGGFGIFYTRVPSGIEYTTNLFDVTKRQNFNSNENEVLDFFPLLPNLGVLQTETENTILRNTADNIRSGYSYQGSLSYERQLAKRTTFSATYVLGRFLHLLRSRNINAPLPGTFDPNVPNSGVRPLPNEGNIYLFESSATFKQQQLIFNLTTRINPKVFIYSKYTLNKSRSDTNGSSAFPSNSYDLTNEFGRANNDIRHRFSVGATINAPFGFRLSPFLSARSGIPFNITIGRDLNGDSIFAERPAFATDLTKPGIVTTRFGVFDPNPTAGQEIIPLNFGTGAAFFVANLRVTKSIPFGQPKKAANGKTDRPYTMRLTFYAQNIFNRNNPDLPIGNLSSSLFGIPISSSTEGGSSNQDSNRRLNFSINISF